MSRVGNLPIKIEGDTKLSMVGSDIVVSGKNGTIKIKNHPAVTVNVSEDKKVVTLSPIGDTKEALSMWGTQRSLLQNAVDGVSKGFKKELVIRGVGYRASVKNEAGKKKIVFSLGFSHPKEYSLEEGFNAEVTKDQGLLISGYDKQKLGQIVAEIMSLRKYDPYKSKGIFIKGSNLIVKEGKKK